MSGPACCILGVCCSVNNQRAALANELVSQGVCDSTQAKKVAKWIVRHFDLAEAGTLRPLFKSAVKLAGAQRKGKG